jgi:hypothetical protein
VAIQRQAHPSPLGRHPVLLCRQPAAPIAAVAPAQAPAVQPWLRRCAYAGGRSVLARLQRATAAPQQAQRLRCSRPQVQRVAMETQQRVLLQRSCDPHRGAAQRMGGACLPLPRRLHRTAHATAAAHAAVQ